MGTISFVGAGSVTAGSGNNVAPAFPATVDAGNLAVLVVVNKLETDSPITPSGWTEPSDNTGTGGTGAAGVDTGPLRCSFFWKECDGSEDSAVVTVSFSPGPGHSGAQGQILVYSKDTGAWAVKGCGTGSVGTDTTDWSQAVSVNPTVKSKDWVISVRGATTDAGTWSAQGITITGCTMGTTSQRGSTGTTNGNDLESNISDTPVNSGEATDVPTVTGTQTVATTGVVGALRIRAQEPSPYLPVLTGSPDNRAYPGYLIAP